jgi:hypothetical protein
MKGMHVKNAERSFYFRHNGYPIALLQSRGGPYDLGHFGADH